MNFTKNQAKAISTLTYSPLEVSNVIYTTPPKNGAPNKKHWYAYRSGGTVFLEYLGGEDSGQNLQVTVKIGGNPKVTDAHIV